MSTERSIWFTPRAFRLHAVILIIVPVFLGLCAWQVERAVSGNELSWAYVFEWPFFAGYAVYMWWKILHETPDAEATEQVATERRGNAVAEAGALPDGHVTEEDAELAAYNRYLAALAARDAREEHRRDDA